MTHSRRDFLLGGASAGAAVPLLASQPLASHPLVAANPFSSSGKILVVLQIDGGWDYFNQIIPVYSQEYYDARPDIAVPDRVGSVLPIDKNVAQKWPIYAQPLKDLYDRGDLAVLNNVGFPNGTLSHFESQERWYSARDSSSEGWLGGYLLRGYKGPQTMPGLDASSAGTGAFEGARVPVIGNSSTQIGFEMDARTSGDNAVELAAMKICSEVPRGGDAKLGFAADKLQRTFAVVQQLASASRFHRPRVQYPFDAAITPLIYRIAALISNGFPSHVYYLRTSSQAMTSFDNHAQLAAKGGITGTFPSRFGAVIGNLKAFLDDMAAYGKGKEVVVLAFSEFSRRFGQNGSQGTDHGHGGVAYLAGEPVLGGFFGKYPDLASATKPYRDWYPDYGRDSIDYRSIYATILERWLGVSSQLVLGAQHTLLPIL